MRRDQASYMIISGLRQSAANDLCEPWEKENAQNCAANEFDPFQIDLKCVNLAIKSRFYTRNIFFASHAAGNAGMDRQGDGFGLGLFKACVSQALHFCNCVERCLGHARLSFPVMSAVTVGSFGRSFQPLRGLLALSLAALLPITAAAQSRPLGAAGEGHATLWESLGDHIVITGPEGQSRTHTLDGVLAALKEEAPQ